MLAWHNNPDLKTETVQRMREHAAADRIRQGNYQTLTHPFRGCLIGCLLPRMLRSPLEGWHDRVATTYGIPRTVGLYLDCIFEYLPPTDAPTFAVDSIEAIPVGADLTGIPLLMVNAALTRAPANAPETVALGPLVTHAVKEGVPEKFNETVRRAAVGTNWHIDAFASVLTEPSTVIRVDVGVTLLNYGGGGIGVSSAQWWATQILHYLASAPVGVVA